MKTAARHNLLINTILLTHPVKINNIVAYLHKSKQQNDCQVQGSTILLHSLSYASYYMYFHLIYVHGSSLLPRQVLFYILCNSR